MIRECFSTSILLGSLDSRVTSAHSPLCVTTPSTGSPQHPPPPRCSPPPPGARGGSGASPAAPCSPGTATLSARSLMGQITAGGAVRKWTPYLESMSQDIRDPTLTSSTGATETTLSSSRLHSIHNATPLTGFDLSLTSLTDSSKGHILLRNLVGEVKLLDLDWTAASIFCQSATS